MNPGDVFADRFEIHALAGEGGMGSVYRALDRSSGKVVALKVLHDRSAQVAQRFVREGNVLGSLQHPGIVAYVAHGCAESGEPYLAMEWLDGETVGRRLTRKPFTLAESVELCMHAAEALGVAHAAGIVHRDVKPENLFLPAGEPRRVKLLDFGIARVAEATHAATRTGALLGSPGYMSPEQARGASRIDARTDVFALGCVLYECLTGTPAFTGDGVMAILAKILLDEAAPVRDRAPAVPPRLDALVARMLSKDQDLRPADGAALAAELSSMGTLDDDDVSPRPVRSNALTTSEQRLLSVVVVPGRAPTSGEAATADASDASVTSSHGGTIDALRSAVAPFGAEIVSLLDGSLLAYVTGAGAATDQSTQAARTALALHARIPGVPIGVAIGRGVLAGHGAVGEAIDRAIALARDAEAGIWMDETAARLLEGRFVIQPGRDGVELIADRNSVDGARTLLGRPTPCVGREREIAKLVEHFEECATDRIARAVLVTAGPGVGKSRLRSEVVRAILDRGNATVWIGRAEPMRMNSPLGLIASMVASVADVGEGEAPSVRRAKLRTALAGRLSDASLENAATYIGELLEIPNEHPDDAVRVARKDPALMGEQIRRAWLDWLDAECARATVVLVFEDLHWSDVLSTRLVDAALRDLADRPLLVLAFARPEVHDVAPKLWRDRDLHEITLREIAKRAAEQLVRAALGADVSSDTLDRLVQRSAGNAFFLEELIRAQAEGKGDALPETVLAMAQVRFERLPMEARRVLRAGSVLGEVFWSGAVRALVGDASADESNRWLDAMVEREVITRRSTARFLDEREYAFRHALVRDAAYATLTESDRALGHVLAGGWLQARGEVDASVIAEHFDRGHDVAQAIDAYVRASEQALRRNDFQSAHGRAGRAIALGATGDALRALHLTSGRALAGLTRWAEARVQLETGLALTPESDVVALAEVLTSLAEASFWMLDGPASKRFGAEGLALAEAMGRDDIAANLLAWLGSEATSTGDVVEGLNLFSRASERAKGSYLPGHAGVANAHYWLGQLHEGRATAEREVALARSVGDLSGLMFLLPAYGMMLAGLGEYRAGFDAVIEAQSIGEKHGIERMAARAECIEGGFHLDLFDLEGAEVIALRARKHAEALTFPPPLVSANLDLLFIHARRGDAVGAQSFVPAVAVAVAKASGWHGWIWSLRFTAARAEIALLEGRLEDAIREASSLIEQDPRRTRVKYQVNGHLLRARALAASGRSADAFMDTRSAVARARPVGDPLLLLRALAMSIELETDRTCAAEAAGLAARIGAAIPDDSMRRAFSSAQLVRGVLGAASG